MNTKNGLAIFRALAWFAGIYHVLLGLAGTFLSADFIADVVSKVYGVNANIDAQFLASARFASSYLLAFGVMMVLVAMKPREYRLFVVPAVVMFATRVFDRLAYFDVLQDAFGITMTQNLQTVVPVALIALGLFFFRPQK